MLSIAYLWIPFVILASLGQVARNAMQRELTASLGTVGATHVRFLFGFPFSIVFFAIVMLVARESVAWPSLSFWLWLVVGTMTQIVATGLMLAAMNERSFVVTTAYIKTEPIQAALFGFIFLADHLTVWKVLAIVVATTGVVITAIRPGGEKSFADLRPTMLGLAAAACFALSAVGYRGAILNVPGVSFVTAASFTLVLGPDAADAGAHGLSAAARPQDARRAVSDVEAVDAGRLHGRGRVAVLVPRLRADQRRQRANAGADRGAVRAGASPTIR